MVLKMRGTGLSKVRRVGIAASSAVFATALGAGIATGADDPPQPLTITGTTVVGDTLTVSPADADDNVQWQRCSPAPGACGEGLNDAGWVTIDDAAGVGHSSYTLVAADLHHLIRVRGKETAQGSKFAPSPAVGPVTAPPTPPPPPLLEGPPPEEGPIFDKTGNVEPTQGTVLVELPNGQVRQIQQVTTIPVGSTVDVSNGHAILTTQRRPGGPLQSTEEWGAPFVFDQKRKGKITQLTLTDPAGGGAERVVAERRRRGGGLWGRGRCRCRTRGQNSSGTARGTFYLVKEKKQGTLTRVKHGKVVVKDFSKGKKVVLRKGESYLARNRNR